MISRLGFRSGSSGGGEGKGILVASFVGVGAGGVSVGIGVSVDAGIVDSINGVAVSAGALALQAILPMVMIAPTNISRQNLVKVMICS